VVILPDVRGLFRFYKELADRFASVGVHACAIDYFGRTAGTEERPGEWDYAPHVRQTDPDLIADDTAAAIDLLRSHEGGGAERVYTVGFCFGGRNSFNQAARGHGLAGVVGFYGRVARTDDSDSDAPVDRVRDFDCPVLGLFGGADQAVSVEDVRSFEEALEDSGVSNEVVVYEGVPHSFFDRKADEFRDVCDDAWVRMLRFFGVPA
jgi:carboxymethylenebutenolidase